MPDEKSELLKKIQYLEKVNIELKEENTKLSEINEQLLANEEEMRQLSEVIFSQQQLLEKKSNELEIQSSQIIEAYNKLKEKEENLMLLNSELEKLSIVASKTDNAITIYDKDLNLLWFNEGFTRLYGYTFEYFIEHIGNNFYEISANPKNRKIVDKCINTRKSVIYQSQTVSADSKLIWTQTTLTPILNKENEIEKIIGIDSDISKLKEAEFEIEKQKNELEGKNIQLKNYNEKIKSSIRYAKTIQDAILPNLEKISEFEIFVYFKPRDVVSGDFYWYSKVLTDNIENNIFAVVDCTGHGVPGAFMSMIGNSLLNEIVNEHKIIQTSEILTTLNKRIVQSLNQEFSSNTDGMDVCLVNIKKIENNYKIEFCGAKRPLFVYDNLKKEILTYKGCRKSIGGLIFSRNTEKFEKKIIENSSNCILYLTSDGYIDQNSTNRKRFGTANLTHFLLEISQNNISKQKQLLETNLQIFMKNEEQRDDIVIIGIKIP